MSKKAFVTAFNDNFKRLTQTIHQLIPDNQQLEAVKNAVHIGSRAKPELYIKHFYEHVVVPFEQQILTRDDHFFLTLDISKLSDQLSQENAEEANSLKDKWQSFTGEQKDILWQYIIVLTKLSQKWNNA